MLYILWCKTSVREGCFFLQLRCIFWDSEYDTILLSNTLTGDLETGGWTQKFN